MIREARPIACTVAVGSMTTDPTKRPIPTELAFARFPFQGCSFSVGVYFFKPFRDWGLSANLEITLHAAEATDSQLNSGVISRNQIRYAMNPSALVDLLAENVPPGQS